jgi:uncharacterized membrane protein SpoIIM required for sporulation
MDINQFLHHRQGRWRRLTEILDRIDQQGIQSLAPREAEEFFSLYRLASSDLNLVQTRTGNPALLEYLEALVGRAYSNLALPRKINLLSAWWEIVRHHFPAAMRAEAGLLAIAFLLMFSGSVFGFVYTLIDPRTAEVFMVPFPDHLSESPSERVRRLEEAERGGSSQIDSVGGHAAFSSMLFTHNIRVSVFVFALGFTFGIGTSALLFYNGAILGSLAALYREDGVLTFFLAWVGPHGSLELPCVLFAGTAGFMLARAMFRRDELTLREHLRKIRPRLADIILGASSLLIVAGFIEGGFSQINEPTLPYWFKILVAALLFLALLFYLFRLPVKAIRPSGAS